MRDTATSPIAARSIASDLYTPRPSIIHQLLSVASRPDILSFALGLPAVELFPAGAFAQAAARILANPSTLQYQPASRSLRSHIVALMAQRGVVCREEQVFLTTGAQQGLYLLAHLLIEPGGRVLAEELIYTGFLQVIGSLHTRILTVCTDRTTGMDVDMVERLLAGGARPALIYAIADGHNPLGVSMSLEKRARLVDLARHYRVPIVEDDAYGFLFYEHAPLPLRALDDEWVFYLGSFSKILAPALRVGWMIVPETLIPRLEVMKEANDIDTATFAQHTVAAYLDMGGLPDHFAALRREYRARRDSMLLALHTYFPRQARWQKPDSGLFIWVDLPDTVDAVELLKVAIETEQVAFIPGYDFCAGSPDLAAHCLRLNFSSCAPDRIEEGIARLARVVGCF